MRCLPPSHVCSAGVTTGYATQTSMLIKADGTMLVVFKGNCVCVCVCASRPPGSQHHHKPGLAWNSGSQRLSPSPTATCIPTPSNYPQPTDHNIGSPDGGGSMMEWNPVAAIW